jgi:hypothetical protein
MAARVMGATTEPSGCSPGFSQRELREPESGFAGIKLFTYELFNTFSDEAILTQFC